MPRKVRAFTLIEVLASLAVMALMLVFLQQIINGTMAASRRAHQQANSSLAAQSTLDTLGNDLSNLVTANGATVFVKEDADRNISIAFLTRTRRSVNAPDTTRYMAVLYQKVNNQIVRSNWPVTWSDTDVAKAATTRPAGCLESIVADNIIGFQGAFLTNDGSVAQFTSGGDWTAATTTQGQVPAGQFKALVLAPGGNEFATASQPYVRSLVVAVAALDDQSAQLAKVSDLATTLGTPSQGQTPQQHWNTILSGGHMNGVPDPVVSSLRTAETTFLLK
ncbi:prepilin-type N-terminal cleavage/methylation domain-containing protein [Terrimicrobium sacchariphilum]|uniref:Prepilin-type N-terminal cleavage/methylation domain-containing protein n=2 Tax=Terrimicrobium sacchariphilum TaxID=690879 RepID=A0A146G7I3_TERSA|nr:prepilin-type N-terminal cleavage/methylation domain-containing protein [Terrimicrobium sacchariphilum]